MGTIDFATTISYSATVTVSKLPTLPRPARSMTTRKGGTLDPEMTAWVGGVSKVARYTGWTKVTTSATKGRAYGS